MIIAESRRLERLVGDLLDLTKLEARQMSISLRPTDVAEVVNTTSEGFRPVAAKGGLALVVHVPEGRPDQRPAPRPIRTAWHSCWPTSLRTRSAFARTSVTIAHGTDPATGACTITVDDDGPGIASGDLERVFERFYQADRGPNRRAGSGLGLAIVAELAAAMGGSVRAASPLSAGGGSRFVVTLRWWQGALPTQTLHDALV